MSSVNELTDSEKSVMLTRLCGWELVRREWKGRLKVAWHNGDEGPLTAPQTIDISTWSDDLETMTCPDLYVPKNMALAWRVLNWAMGQNFWMDSVGGYFSDGVWQVIGNEETALLPPADAQRVWLDKILELAIAAGMVDAREN